MDSITHLTQKILAERARQQPTTTNDAPPPYEEEEEEDMDSDSEESSDLPVKLTISASHTIKGSNNLIPTSPNILSDTTKFSTLLLHAINQINAANTHANSEAAQSSKMRRAVQLDLTIHCGVTVIGDRNVIGNVGVRPRVPAATTDGQGQVVVGAKRKAEEDGESEEPAAKKVDVSTE